MRNYEMVTIDDNNYYLHPVKLEKKEIGFVPVRAFPNATKFIDFVKEASQGELELIMADFSYGLTVRLQRMARDASSGDKFTDAQFDKIANSLSSEQLAKFAGHMDTFRENCRQIWLKQQVDIETDAKHIWQELL